MKSLRHILGRVELARRQALSRELRSSAAQFREIADLLENLNDEVGRDEPDCPAREAIRRVMEDK